MEKENTSVKELWKEYLHSIGENITGTNKTYDTYHFCNDEKNANELAQLVVKGIKRATAGLHLFYEIEKEEIPKTNDLSIITNWQGVAQCVVKATKVTILPFKDVTEDFARTEGEGDKSLKYWRECHKKFFNEELQELDLQFNEEMLVVCEEFEVVYKTQNL